MEFNVTSNSSKFTSDLGKSFSKFVDFGDVILFSGELGAGKTTFISGLAMGLGVREDLSSPSFTILNIYPLKDEKKFVHADFYRLGDIREMIDVGIEDYLYGSDCVVCIEWGNKIKDYLENRYLEVEIDYLVNAIEGDRVGYKVGSGNGNSSTKSLKDSFNIRIITFRSGNDYWRKKLKKFKHDTLNA
ncbi:MAG: tRNA (adenosine(37)-N6)-threonylcarbamoyltransferase complex ATPase subunit type 1 TsaE [Actinobacteria bacterium]|nr:tRNA (adenosine(37)-N6)-threonylcarbamoyltransferase complex ATPase subunit type 1 TsaE [Actinomycetota bacterium]